MASRRKIGFVIFLIVSFIGLVPISWLLADRTFTHPFPKEQDSDCPVLLVWPDHVEIRWFRKASEVSPRPTDAGYTFAVPPDREAWVKSKVASTPAPDGADAGWIIRVKQISPSRQRIQLELLGDGIHGIIYEATRDEIVPLRLRLTGPSGAYIFGGIQMSLWGGLGWFVRWRVLPRFARTRPSTGMIQQP